MNDGTTKPNGGSKEMAVQEDDPKVIDAKRRMSGYEFAMGFQFFEADPMDKSLDDIEEINNMPSTTDLWTTNVVGRKRFRFSQLINSIVNGLSVKYGSRNKNKSDKTTSKKTDRQEKADKEKRDENSRGDE